MRGTRSLSLKREALSDLSANELVAVVGGQEELTHLGCNLTDACGHGISFDYCPTIPVNICIRPKP
jgi:hypothetical protein